MVNAQNRTIKEWTDLLASSAPAPGGGGVGALLGALSACLASMVGQLTAHKKGHETFSRECEKLNEKAKALQERMLELIDEDALVFENLVKAWKSNATDKDYAEASAPAVKTIFEVIEVLDILSILKEKGNQNVLSDVGIGASCVAAALEASRINILVNLQYIVSPEYRKEFETLLETLIPEGIKRARDIIKQVEKELE